ncbi:MAG: oxidoreductase [Chloroflexota bacterium]
MTTTAAPIHRLDAQSLDALRAGIDGTVVVPGDPEYDEARQIVSITFDRYPAAIVRCAGTQDVAFAVRFARERGIAFVPRSGGHAVWGHSVQDGALLIDLGGMKAITIDPIERTAVVQPGVRSNELGAAAGVYGLALTTGDTGSVGIGGLTVGGGIGWMVRKYGLTIDSLLAATVVTAEGAVLRVSATQHPDLFWAIRGGGSNFGIITDFTFRLAPSGMVHAGLIVLPATREVLRGYVDYTPRASEDLTTIAFMMAAPPAPFIPEEVVGQPVVLVGVVWTGDERGLDEALAPLRSLAQPIADTVTYGPYPMMFAYFVEAEQRHGASIRSMFADDLSDAQLDALVTAMRSSSSPLNEIQLRGLGGAMARVPADATAFAHRDVDLMVSIISIWLDPEDDGAAHRQWTRDTWEHIAAARRGTYVNFLQDDGEARKQEAYLEGTMRRLQAVKAKYDPDNVFAFNVNVAPAR